MSETSMNEDAQRAALFLSRRLEDGRPRFAVVLGSGLGSIAASLERASQVPMQEIPGMLPASVAGHAGRVCLGWWGRCCVLAFQGRLHLYEGHPVETITLSVRTAAELGVRDIVLTNAAGSCDGAIPPGSLMRADDLLDLFFRRIRGRVRAPYVGRGGVLDADLGGILDEAARCERIDLRHGVLCGSLGPSYETAAEVRLWRRLGAGAACMSTVPEAFAARAAGMRVAVVSLITNFGTGLLAGARLDHSEVVAAAGQAGEDLGRLLRRAAAILCGGS